MNTCPAVLIELIDELGAENDQLKAQLQQQYHERLVKLVGLLRDISKLTRSQRMDDMVWGVHAARIAVALYQHPEPPPAQDEREAYTDWYKETYKTSPLGFDGSSDYRAFHAGAEWQRTRPAKQASGE